MDPLKYAEQIAYCSKQVLRFTYEKAKEYADKPGIYVECGCAAGAQIIAMAAGAPNKTIYAFDSFEGIPLPSNKDNQMPGIRFLTKAEQEALPDPGKQVLESSGATVVSIESFWNNVCTAFDIDQLNLDELKIVPVRGWFEDTLPHFECPPISILRLDGDLYNSTYTCLKYLFPNVIEGGIIIVDDFALPGCRQAVMDFWGENNILPKYGSIKDKNSHVIYWFKDWTK